MATESRRVAHSRYRRARQVAVLLAVRGLATIDAQPTLEDFANSGRYWVIQRIILAGLSLGVVDPHARISH